MQQQNNLLGESLDTDKTRGRERWGKYCKLVGNFRTEPRPKIFPLRNNGKTVIGQSSESEKQQIAQTLRARDYANWNGNFALEQIGTIGKDSEATRVYSTDGIARTIKNGGGMGAKTGLYQVLSHYGHINKEPTISDLAPTLKAQSHGHEPMVLELKSKEDTYIEAVGRFEENYKHKKEPCSDYKKFGYCSHVESAIKRNENIGELYSKAMEARINAIAVLTPDRPEKRQNGRRFKEAGEPSFTLTAQDKHGILYDSRIRRLTPLECERLQGFPDGWTEGISDSQRYKCLGNAVSVNVVREIMKKVLEG